MLSELAILNQESGTSGAVQGTSDLNITQDLTISVPDDNVIQFGLDRVDHDADFAIINSLAGNDTINGSWANGSDGIVIRNDGNVGINLTVSFDKNAGKNGTSFACWNDSGDCGVGFSDFSDPEGLSVALGFAYLIEEDEVGSCGGLIQDEYLEIENTDFEYLGCDCLKSASISDEVGINLRVGMPKDALGTKEVAITFISSISDMVC